jgi:hypothetical protein
MKLAHSVVSCSVRAVSNSAGILIILPEVLCASQISYKNIINIYFWGLTNIIPGPSGRAV